ncbi:MAG: hypothetical protein WC919_01205 [Candidatus Paceibacterota bacterium]
MYYSQASGTITYDPHTYASLMYPTKSIIYNDGNGNKLHIKKIMDCMAIAHSYKAYRASYATTTSLEDNINNTSCYNYIWKSGWGGYNTWSAEPMAPPIPLSDRFRQILQSRQAPLFITSRTPIKAAAEEREMRARQTLRKILGDDGFQRFLRNGFVSVRANSGKVYQIYPGHGMTVVYDRGTPIEKLCVVLRGDFTPTDSLITRYVMILHDEAHFRTLANVWTAPAKRVPSFRQLDTRPLTQIFQSLKAAA